MRFLCNRDCRKILNFAEDENGFYILKKTYIICYLLVTSYYVDKVSVLYTEKMVKIELTWLHQRAVYIHLE